MIKVLEKSINNFIKIILMRFWMKKLVLQFGTKSNNVLNKQVSVWNFQILKKLNRLKFIETQIGFL